jgi:hypothetical protein
MGLCETECEENNSNEGKSSSTTRSVAPAKAENFARFCGTKNYSTQGAAKIKNNTPPRYQHHRYQMMRQGSWKFIILFPQTPRVKLGETRPEELREIGSEILKVFPVDFKYTSSSTFEYILGRLRMYLFDISNGNPGTSTKFRYAHSRMLHRQIFLMWFHPGFRSSARRPRLYCIGRVQIFRQVRRDNRKEENVSF